MDNHSIVKKTSVNKILEVQPNNQKIPNKKTIKTIQQSECGHELESFDNVEDLFKSWEDSSTKDDKLDSSDRHRSLNRKTKEKILSRLLKESAGKICRDTDAAHSQDFLYGEDGMPN